jgi:hypothetical protein
VVNASIGADNRRGGTPQACTPDLRGVPGHATAKCLTFNTRHFGAAIAHWIASNNE